MAGELWVRVLHLWRSVTHPSELFLPGCSRRRLLSYVFCRCFKRLNNKVRAAEQASLCSNMTFFLPAGQPPEVISFLLGLIFSKGTGLVIMRMGYHKVSHLLCSISCPSVLSYHITMQHSGLTRCSCPNLDSPVPRNTYQNKLFSL